MPGSQRASLSKVSEEDLALVDLHCHTHFSHDNLLDPRDLLMRAAELGLYGVGIVEHHSFRASEPVSRLAGEFGVRIFRGVEISTDRGHILVFGVTDDRWNRWGRNLHLPLDDVLSELRKMGALCIPAHPYRSHVRDGLGDDLFLWQDWGAVETHNGLNTLEDDEKALRAARILGLPQVGGSDCHRLEQVGRCLTGFERPPRDLWELMEEIRSGRCRALRNQIVS